MEPITYRSYRTLPTSLADETASLIASCEAHDGTRELLDLSAISTFSWSSDICHFFTAHSNRRLIGIVSLFIPDPEEAELAGFIHPAFRYRGMFTSLLNQVQAELNHFSIGSLLYVCNSESIPGITYLEGRRCRLAHTELTLQLEARDCKDRIYSGNESAPAETMRGGAGIEIHPATPADLDLLCDLNHDIFGESETATRSMLEKTVSLPPYTQFIFRQIGELNETPPGQPVGMGSISWLPGEKQVFLFGFGILPPFRKRGLGRAALQAMLQEVRKQTDCPVILEVNSSNTAACHLYTSCGFREISAYRYYRPFSVAADP